MSFEQRLAKFPITSFGFFSLWSKEGLWGACWPLAEEKPQVTVDEVVSNLWNMCWDVRAKCPGEAKWRAVPLLGSLELSWMPC